MNKRYSLGACQFFPAMAFGVMCLAVAGRGIAARGAEPQWRYVVPKAGDPMEYPPLRELSLSEKKPPDLKESAHYRGRSRRYAEFRFGAVGSALVTVVLDRVSAVQTDVYVDLNRNRAIEDNDRLTGPGPRYRVPLSVEILKGGRTERFSRTVVFRVGRSGQSISYATAGYVEGTLRFEGREIPVRRVDANGDGGMADPADLLWMNWKRDGNWNPFTDRLPLTPIIQVENQRYVVRSDWVGERLSLEKLEGSGELHLSLPKGKSTSDFLEIDLVLIGRDGSIAKLDMVQDRVEVPVGDYCVYELSTIMKDPAGGEPWAFFLGRPFDWAGSRGYSVKAKDRVPIHPFDGLTLDAKVGSNEFQYHPGDAIAVQPRLETADHLTLRACYRSDKVESSRRHPGAEIRLRTLSGKTLDSATSGFT
ncbi:MAG: hypothetical protein ACLQNE_36870 [Thermoguttaceae bacterium]